MLAVMIVVAFSLTAVSSALDKGVTMNAAAAITEVKVGWMSQIAFWNPMHIEMVEDYVACYLMFSSLFLYDQDWGGPVNDLATGWYQTLNPNGSMTTTINITSHAFFRNMVSRNSVASPLTAYDVKYTLERIMANPGGTWDTYLYNIINIKVNSNTQLEILTDFPKATLIDDLTQIPIISSVQWSSISDQQFLSAKKPDWLMGSGPFYYNNSASTWYRFSKCANYHGSTDYPSSRVVKIDNILYTVYGDPQALTLAMNSGQQDTIDLSGQPNLYLNTLGVGSSVTVTKQAVQEPGICDVAINGIPSVTGVRQDPVQFRSGQYGTGNPLLLDPIVRKAICMTLDKDTIKNGLMSGLVTVADSVVQPGYWHKAVTTVPYDPSAAKAMLLANGYADTDGDTYLEATASAFPVGNNSGMNIDVPVGAELNFRLHAPTNEPSYMAIGENWVGWAADAGIRFNYRAYSESVMTNADWFKSDYDVWVWHWGWSPEPLGAILEVWTTSEIGPGKYNCQGPMGPWWYGPDNQTRSPTGKPWSSFDENWTDALGVLDKTERKAIVDNLQQMIADSYTENPPFYDLGLYAYTEERFIGWGDWVAHSGLSTKSDLPWLWFNLEPKGNTRPIFDTPLSSSYTIIVNQPQVFQVIVHDVDPLDTLWVNWSFGDGTAIVRNITGSAVTNPTMFSQTHTYTTLNSVPGYTLTVTLWDGQPSHERSSTSVVYVVALPDNGPALGAMSPDLPSGAYNDTVVTWTASASDAESGGPSGYGLLFTWRWGDGTYTVTRHQPTVNNTPVTDSHAHSWALPGTYNVNVSVWDGFGLQSDTGHNVSSQIPYEIVENTPPDIPLISAITGTEGTWVTCLATTLDLDPDTLRVTWDWGNGSYNVTDYDNSLSPGTAVHATAKHMWATQGNYAVTVYVDDLTGFFGHNSSWADVAVITATGINVPPSAVILTATPTPAYNNTLVTLNASAIDTDSDPLTFSIDFGDGSWAVVTTAGGTVAPQYADPEFTHAYSVPNTYTATVYADDGQGHNVSGSAFVEVIANEPPWIIYQSSASGSYNKTFTLTPQQVQDNDSDPVSVWYDWGDSTSMTPGNPGTYTGTHIYRVTGDIIITAWANDGFGQPGHNVSKSVTVKITDNLEPQFKAAMRTEPAKNAFNKSETITFFFLIWDYEGDNVTLTVSWGDGTANETRVYHVAADINVTVNLTHAYAAAKTSPYEISVLLKDDADHYLPTWATATASVKVNEPTNSNPKTEGLPWALIGGVILVIAAVLILLVFLMRRRRKEERSEGGGMEGMKPPEEPPPA